MKFSTKAIAYVPFRDGTSQTEIASQFDARSSSARNAPAPEVSLSFPTMLLHSALLLDVLLLLYLNFYLKHESFAPFFLLTPWVTARWARNYFIRAHKRNLTGREKRILCSNSLRSWSLLSYGLRFWFATTYLNWMDLLVCVLVFSATYPFGRFLHLALLRWGFKNVSDEQLAYMLGLPALPSDYLIQQSQSQY